MENMVDVYMWYYFYWCEYNFVEELKIMYMFKDLLDIKLKKKFNKVGRLYM